MTCCEQGCEREEEEEEEDHTELVWMICTTCTRATKLLRRVSFLVRIVKEEGDWKARKPKQS